jgi:hypothetical protein
MTDQVLISSLRQLTPQASVDTAVKRRFAATTLAARPGDQHGQGQVQGVKRRICCLDQSAKPQNSLMADVLTLVQPAAESDSCGITACRGIRQALPPTTRTSPTTIWPPRPAWPAPTGSEPGPLPTLANAGPGQQVGDVVVLQPSYGSGA